MTTATLGGITLRGANSYDWELRAGVAPVERHWTIPARNYYDFYSLLGTAQTLEINGPRKTLTVKGVYPLEILPGPNPNLKVLRVADARWAWSRRWVASSFNVRRVTGNTFLLNDAGQLENAVVQPEIRYAEWSLYPVGSPTSPWEPNQVLEYVLEQVGAKLSYANSGAILSGGIEVQDLELDDPGDAAVDRVMGYFPGLDLYIDHDGSVVVYDTLADGGGKGVLDRLNRKQVTGPDIGLTDRYSLRPSKFIVLVTPEVECRFDYTEDGSRRKDTPVLKNVAPSPDATISIASSTGGERSCGRGSLIQLTTLFEEWGVFGQFGAALSNDILRRHGFAAGLLESAYGNNPQAPFDSVAAARIRATLEHWRRTYQIDETFMQRLAAVRPYRATMLNTETGARAPAAVYCDWVRRPSVKGFAKAADQNVTLGWAVRGHNDLLENAKVAPARLSVVDPQSGALRVDPLLDPFGLYDAIILGYPDNGYLPMQNGGAEANRTGLESYAQWSAGRLASDFELSTVLTVVPGSPNNLSRFVKFEFDSVQFGLIGNGPPMYVRVFPGVMTARYAWSDGAGTQIVDAIQGRGEYPAGQLANKDEVEAVARAAAQRACEAFADRPVGGADVDLAPDLKPTGAVGSVRHVLAGGATVTQARVTGVRAPADILRYLPASYRKAINRILHEEGGP